MKKIVLITVSTLICILLAGVLFISFYVNGERVSTHLNDALGEEYTVSVREATFNLFTRTLSVEDIVLHIGDEPAGNQLFHAEKIVAGRINIIEALNGTISLGYLAIDTYTVDLTILPENSNSQHSDDTVSTPFPFIESVEFQNGTVHFTAANDGKGVITGLNMSSGPLTNDPDCGDCTMLDRLENIEISISSVDLLFNKDRYLFQVHDIQVSERDSVFQAGKLRMESTLDEQAYFQSLEYRSALYLFDISGFKVDQVNFSELRGNGDFIAGTVSVDSLDLHVTEDVGIPKEPDTPDPLMPAVAFRNLPLDIAVDFVIVDHADIRYSEYRPDSQRPGTILFANTKATIANLSNRTSDPVVLKAHSYFEGNGVLTTEISLSMNENGWEIVLSGAMGKFDIERLNNFFVDHSGIQIKSGMVSELEFAFTMTDLGAYGFISINYDQLSIELIDKEDHSKSLGNRISGFLLDKVVLRASSGKNDGESRIGKISKERDPERGFFTYLWLSLRSGIFDVLFRI